jgi:hypothetical protein
MQGDKLASGGKSATFGPPAVTQKKWDAIWKEETQVVLNQTASLGDHARRYLDSYERKVRAGKKK